MCVPGCSEMTDYRKIAVVTGANGFLAQNLIPSLTDEGWHVIGVSREKGSDNACQVLSWEEFWRGDLLDPTQIKALFHLAAFIPPNMEDSTYAPACLNTNALLTLKLAEHMAAHGRARFVYCSGGLVKGFEKASLTEHAHGLALHRACFYLLSKLVGEVYVERTRKLKELNAITFRVGACYGPWMPARSMVSRFAALAKLGKPLPLRHGGAEQFDLIYAPDVVQCLVRAAKSEKQGIFNAGSGQVVTVREVAETVNRVFGNQSGITYEEPRTPPLQPGFAPLAMRRTTTAFGWKPRSLSQGLKDFRSWLQTRQAP